MYFPNVPFSFLSLDSSTEPVMSYPVSFCLILMNSGAQVGSHGIEASWAGGKRGREVMDRFFPMVSQLLSEQGLFYLVTVSDNNPGRRICERV